MPKSFLVKKRQRIKDCPPLEENIYNDEDERNIGKSDETHLPWKPCVNEIQKPAVGPWPWESCATTKDGAAKLDIVGETESPPEGEAKLVDHEKVELSRENIGILSRSFNPAVHHESPEETDETQCDRCQRTYTTNAALVKHQRYYCNFFQTKSFTCKYCDKVYLSLGALKMHIRTHTLPCRCMICGKSFSRPWLLQGHIRTHTGEKPYECSNCNRAFADRSNLRAHLQTHSDIKKYKCERCSKTFSRMSLLLKHQNACCTII